jgi:hypothetical protein
MHTEASLHTEHQKGDENVSNNSRNVVVRVRYAPVKQPFTENHTPQTDTLADVKARALAHFHLSEGSVDGGSKTYSLSLNGEVQTNLSLNVGDLAEHRQLSLLLVEQFTQG